MILACLRGTWTTPKPLTGLRCGQGKYRGGVSTLLAIFWSIMAVLPAAAESLGPGFTEPFSGRRVDEYKVTISVARDRRETFLVPGQCERILGLFKTGLGLWNGPVDRVLAHKVTADCEYYNTLSESHTLHRKDFVSGYDYQSACLADLPFQLYCDSLPGGQDREACLAANKARKAPSYLDVAAAGLPEYHSRDLTDCRLRQGMFRGRMVVRDGVLRCEWDPIAPGFRLIASDFLNVDGDEYLDVALRLVPIGPGRMRVPLVFALTREQEGGAFRYLEGMDFINTLRRGR